MSFIRECDFEYTAYFEQFQVYRLLASIKRTSGCEPIPHMGLQTLTDELTAFTP